ncbi:hypothetical protein FOCC_FOCC011956 [Frankliniella occidentalis]|nr:hypothetical protein FOCC_FOCC011956 [Frankliniella occidentalis]
MNASNSLYGCTFCLQKTVRTTSGRRFAGDKFGQLRSHESINQDMKIALENSHKSDPRSRGVWAPSILQTLEFFDLGQGFAPDYLHAVLLGCVKQHTELLLTRETKKNYWTHLDVTEDIRLDHVIALVDKEIDKIVVPHCITRLPRGLKDRENWKASEWRSWLLFYCLVCLQGQLKKKYLIHLAHLCVAVHILLQKSISPSQLKYAEELLIKYVVLYEHYFKDVSMNYCIHLLPHLVEGVRNFGPLFTHNTFLYEGQNRFLLQLLSSPFCVAKQLAKKYTTFSCLPELCSKLASTEKSADFCASIVGRQLSNFVRSGDTVLVGKGTACTLTDEERLCLERHNIAVELNVQNFNRFIHKGSRYCTRAYAKKKC